MNKFSSIISKIVFTGLVIAGTASISGCKQKFHDYTKDGSVKLELDYEGKDFYIDGIGEFELAHTIDGDTAHFTPKVDSTHQGLMKARFFGIDTPESTGKVQEYGHAASDFTKGKLLEAAEKGTIVISSPQSVYAAPNPDSTGSRYVSLVWINTEKKNATRDELVLLNLWIVQEGLSWVKNVGDMPQYEKTFYAAEEQAKKFKLKLHSGEADPDFNYGEYYETSLLDVKNEIKECLADPTHENKYDNYKMRIQGTVCGYSNHILYLQDFCYYDQDDESKGGEMCGINIFVGMGSISSKYTKLNTYIEVCGLAQYTENYGFQVTDTQGRFPVGSATSPNDARVIYTPSENADTEHNLVPAQYTKTALNNVADATDPYNLECLNTAVEVTETLTCSKMYLSESGKEVTLRFDGASFNAYIPFNYHGDPSKPADRWTDKEDFEGRQFTIKGVYVLHKTQAGDIRFQIVPNGESDLVWVQPSND